MTVDSESGHVLPANEAPLPPGPRGNLLWGMMGEVRRDRLGFLMRMRRDFGDVSAYRIANLKFVQINHPDGVQRVLQTNNRNYIRGNSFNLLRRYVGDGLLTSDGDYWLRQRRLMQPAFHRRRIAAFGEMMVSEATAMLERWAAAADREQPVEILPEMSRLTLTIVSKALFGQAIDDDSRSLSQAVTVLLADQIYRFDHPFAPPMFIPTPTNRRVQQAQAELDRIVYGLIERAQAGQIDGGQWLAMLVDARDEETGETMSRKELRDETLTMFVAGHETTAGVLTWALLMLDRHPDVRNRLRTELDEVLAGRLPTMADVPQLTYTRQIIDETLRLYPSAWITNRETLEDDVIDGFRVPADHLVAISPYVVHRDARFWPEPERFDPDRFGPDGTRPTHHYAYFPFGGGPHLCIGNNFALAEAQLVLATIAQRYRLASVSDQPVEPEALTTLRAKGSVPMRLVPVS